MRYFSADYIFPISSAPIKNGILVVDDSGVIIDVLTPNPKLKTENYKGILCPGFINAHCHLELSHLKGKISEKKGLPDFIGEIESVRRNFPEEEIKKAIVSAEGEMLKNGIVGVGDISNSDFSFEQKSKGRLKYHTFIEALGFHPDKAQSAFELCLNLKKKSSGFHLPASITPHAPYSASEKLLKKINDFALNDNFILSIHNQENEDENKMFLEGKGKILERLKLLGIDISQWKPTGKNSTETVLPLLSNANKILLVHNTFTSRKDIHFLKFQPDSYRVSSRKLSGPNPIAIGSQIFFCFCPNANLYIENRLPDFQIFVNENCKITVGTDSLASNWSLSVLDELKTISKNLSQLNLQTLLTWATRNGAEFFGWDNELGTFEQGKKPGIVLIKNPDMENLKLTEKSEAERII